MVIYSLLAPLFLSPLALAGDEADVRTFFDSYVERSNQFDADIGALYADDAKISTLRDGTQQMSLTGAQWKQVIPQAMEVARKRGDKSTFDDIKITSQGDLWRVTASRTPLVKCIPDPKYRLDVKRAEDGWLIVEEYTETWSLSKCKPSKKLAAALKAMQAGLKPHLPLDLDADTRLETIEVSGPNLIYGQRLHTIGAAEMDMSKLVPMLRQGAFQNVCGTAEIKALTTQGATVRYSYVDRDGTLLTNVDIPPGVCE